MLLMNTKTLSLKDYLVQKQLKASFLNQKKCALQQSQTEEKAQGTFLKIEKHVKWPSLGKLDQIFRSQFSFLHLKCTLLGGKQIQLEIAD